MGSVEPLFQYYGGKSEFIDWYLGMIPRHHTCVEGFWGAGSFTIAKSPAAVEVGNDKNGRIVNLFEVLRTRRDELAQAVELTPYSLYEWQLAHKKLRQGVTDKLEAARCFLVTLRQSRGTSPGTAWSRVVDHSRRGMASSVSRWLNVPDYIHRIADRLLHVQFDCMDFEELVAKYARPETLFFMDPPYLDEERNGSGSYGEHEMSWADHKRLLRCLILCPAKVMLCGYMSELYRHNLTPARGWVTHIRRVGCRSNVRANGSVGDRPVRDEVCWIKGG